MEYPTSHLYFLERDMILKPNVYTNQIKRINKSEKWHIPRCTTRERLYHARENNVANSINAAQDDKVGCNNVEYTTAFLYSDWLYFLWHGIKASIIQYTKPYPYPVKYANLIDVWMHHELRTTCKVQERI